MKEWERLHTFEHLEKDANDVRLLFPRLAQSNYVPGEGAEKPVAFIVGEAPGAEEDMRRRPFVGRSGQVLHQLMDFAGLWTTDSNCDKSKPANAWITNVVKFRPPGNATPTDAELYGFRQLLMREWILVGKPRLIIPVGATALKAITKRQISILRVAGKPLRSENTSVTVYPMIHPSYGLRGDDAVKEKMESHWERLRKWRASNPGT